MDPATVAAGAVTVNEAIQQIKPLLAELIQRVKDRDTASLVSQIQGLDQAIQSAYLDAKQETIKLATESFEQKRSHAEAIDNLNAAHVEKVSALEKEIARLNAAQRQPVAKSSEQISEGEISVVRILASAEDGASPEELNRLLNIPMTSAKFQLETLKGKGMAKESSFLPNRGMVWELTPQGRAYAHKRNLIGSPPPGLPGRYRGPTRG